MYEVAIVVITLIAYYGAVIMAVFGDNPDRGITLPKFMLYITVPGTYWLKKAAVWLSRNI